MLIKKNGDNFLFLKAGPITTGPLGGYVKSVISVLKIAKKIKHLPPDIRYTIYKEARYLT
jgi:hypothetical protein